MHELISLGVGHLKAVHEEDFNTDINYPVYIDEPLLILSVISILERRQEAQRRVWLLLDNFGGKFTALGEVFYVVQPSLASRKVTLVALRRTSDDKIECCRSFQDSYSSDRLSFKATSPKEILSFLHNPNGILFLFPDAHMDPDVIAYFQEEDTGELIVLTAQLKARQHINAARWRDAVRSITPDLFYTAAVRPNIRKFHRII